MKRPRVLVVGDVGLDKTRVGKPERLSPESTHTPVLVQTQKHYNPAMAANVAANISAMGCEVALFGAVGETNGDFDEDGDLLEDCLEEDCGVVCRFLGCEGRPTSVKHRTVSSDGHLLCRVDAEDRSPVFNSSLPFRKAVTAFEQEIKNCHCVVLSDYGKGFLDEETCRYIIAEAEKLSLPIIADPKHYPWRKFAGSRVYLTPNMEELACFICVYKMNLMNVLTAADTVTTPELLHAVHASALEAICKLNISGVITTLGPRGLLFSMDENSRHYVRTKPVYPADVCGAGDVVTAQIAAGVATEMLAHLVVDNPKEPAPIAVYDKMVKSTLNDAVLAANLSVQTPGVTVIAKQQLDRERASRHWARAECYHKIVHANSIDFLAAIRDIRHDGSSIVFTNGVFDLLHAGHIHTLQWARKQADDSFLIVGVNSDKSVQKVKGKSRPVIAEHNRVQCLAALACVDLVVIFEEEDVERLLDTLLPVDIYVKGEEYKDVGVPYAHLVVEHGGRVEFAPMQPSALGTSGIIKAIKDSH